MEILNRAQFDLLSHVESSNRGDFPSRQLKDMDLLNAGHCLSVLDELLANGAIAYEGNALLVTDIGRRLLEPYRVKRAVFMAAGFGSRMVPVTLTTPKPLIKVHGKRIIDTLLDAVLAAGITDIVIVRGYKGEQFDKLLEKYPMIRFIENPLYDVSNNISSGYVARDLYKNAYVLDSDLLLYNPSLIRKYEYESNYLGVPVEKTDDWCFEAPGGIITRIKIGGENVYHWIGLSFWTAKEGAKMQEDIVKVFNSPGGKDHFWDEVPLQACKEHYQVHVRPIERKDIVEIDTFQELCELDPSYAGFTGHL